MNIALIALAPDQTPLLPPLALVYLAALLEQQRHIVRVYDLALSSTVGTNQSARLLRAFRPQVVVVMGEDDAQLGPTVDELSGHEAAVIPLRRRRDDVCPMEACREVLAAIGQHDRINDSSFISLAVSSDETAGELDGLPFPARHLLELECYGLRACGGELQTTLLIGQTSDNGDVVLRRPEQVVNELRSVSREHGVRHYLLCGAPLTADLNWLREFAQYLVQADLEVAWEGAAKPERLTAELLALLHAAGCEALRFDFDVTQVLEATDARNDLKSIVCEARQLGIHARAELSLAPPYESIPQLVDVAATFGLDDVIFHAPVVNQPPAEEGVNVAEMARRRYTEGRNRQHFIERFGPRLGSLVWNVRQSQLIGQLWNALDEVERFEREDIRPIG